MEKYSVLACGRAIESKTKILSYLGSSLHDQVRHHPLYRTEKKFNLSICRGAGY